MIEQRVDYELKIPCVVTARGYGKFNVLAFDGETKRGRLRLVAQKYV
jgi:RNA-binding protein YlmH